MKPINEVRLRQPIGMRLKKGMNIFTEILNIIGIEPYRYPCIPAFRIPAFACLCGHGKQAINDNGNIRFCLLKGNIIC